MPKIIMMGGSGSGGGGGGTSVNTWRSITTPTTQLPNFAMDAHGFGSDVYVVGNFFEFAKYTPGSNTWTALTAVPNHGDTTLFGSGFLTDFGGNLLYFTQESGAGSGGPAHTLTYNIGGNSWSETRTACPQGLNFFAAGQVSGKVYILGGAINGTLVDTVHIYNLAGNSWSTGAVLPAGVRAFGASAVVGNLIYCWFGGTSTFTDIVAELWVYDTVGNSWSAGPTPPYTPFFASAQTLANGTILLYGGQATFAHDPNGNGTPVGLALIFDPVAGTYSSTGTFPFATGRDCSAVLNGKVYGIAGSPAFGGNPLSYVYASAPIVTAADVPGVVAVGAQNTPAAVYAANGASGFVSISTDAQFGKAGVEGRGFYGVIGRGSNSGVIGYAGTEAGVLGNATANFTYGIEGEDNGHTGALGVFASSLGVGNAQAPGALTTVVKNVPIFDGAGNLLGYLRLWT